ncbi:MAG: class I SAM-dependent methyltransferase [Gammaproteobacteria bacterium]|nr:class I SAM-dependent methyltransferase [Gammaproteobacteria bacterium]
MAHIAEDAVDNSQQSGGSALSVTANSTLQQKATRLARLMSRRFGASAVCFDLVLPDGSKHHIGAGAAGFRLDVADPRAIRAIATFDEGVIANAYINGWFDVQGNIIEIYDLRQHLQDRHPLMRLWRALSPLLLGQVSVNRKAIGAHYERDHSFYLSFLDEEFRCYTQGIFETPDELLADAIRRKMAFILEQCRMTPGSEVLDVGVGWGSFAEYAARRGIRVTGVTIAEQSLKFMQELVAQTDLPITTDLVDVLEYRPDRQFDAIAILGVMEHLPNYDEVLACFDRLLKPGGYVFLDASAIPRKYQKSSFITRHIYPGNHSFFVLHDFLRALALKPFDLKGVWDDRHSYYLTFLHWAQRFDSNREFIINKFGEADYRRFRLYLWGSAHCFLRNRLQCYRLVLQKHE